MVNVVLISKRDKNNFFCELQLLTVKFLLPKANTVHYGHDSLKYLGCKIWNIIPNEMKLCESVETFKSAIKYDTKLDTK